MSKLQKASPFSKSGVAQSPRAAIEASALCASTSTRVSAVARSSKVLDVRSSSPSLHPHSSAEQYWAARALTAEALLSARTLHHHEMRNLSLVEETKRSRELAALAQASEAKQAKLEKLVLILLTLLLLFFGLVIYLVTYLNHHRSLRQRRFSPSHFTIPILSPFTSVVEHETSVIGSKAITVFLLIVAALGYAVFRHWISRFRTRLSPR